MSIKIIKQLANASYTGKDLDQAKASRVVKLLNRKELKEYLRLLKKQEQQNSIRVESAYSLDSEQMTLLQNLFPSKKMFYTRDASLLLGLRVIDNDIVYNFNLADSLKSIEKLIEENYD